MDVQLENAVTPDRFIFVSERHRGRLVAFHFSIVRFDAEKQDNVPVSTGIVSPDKFSAHWEDLKRQGWRVCPK
jgi:hypothetical protein